MLVMLLLCKRCAGMMRHTTDRSGNTLVNTSLPVFLDQIVRLSRREGTALTYRWEAVGSLFWLVPSLR